MALIENAVPTKVFSITQEAYSSSEKGCNDAQPMAIAVDVSTRRTFIDRQQNLINYLHSCVTAGDWHGVRDAASDIEVVQAKINILDGQY